MKKLIAAAIIALLILIGFTFYVYQKDHSAPPVQVINNTASTGPKQKYIPRIPVPSSFPEQPPSPVPAGVAPYFGTWVVTSPVGSLPYPATNAISYGVGKTITIEADQFTNNCEMYPESMKNPQYNIIYPSTSDLLTSYYDIGSPSEIGLYGGVETLVVNTHGSVPNQDPKFNFGTIYLMGDYIVVNSNGVFFKCVRK